MKTLLIHLENEEYEIITRSKGDKTWREFLLSLVPSSKEIFIKKVEANLAEKTILEKEADVILNGIK